jgi:hypothetical protein
MSLDEQIEKAQATLNELLLRKAEEEAFKPGRRFLAPSNRAVEIVAVDGNMVWMKYVSTPDGYITNKKSYVAAAFKPLDD